MFPSTDMLNTQVLGLLERYGYRVDHPGAVAERAIIRLVRGENESCWAASRLVGVLAERQRQCCCASMAAVPTPEWRADGQFDQGLAVTILTSDQAASRLWVL